MFQMDPAAAAFGRRHRACARQTPPGAHDRMTGEWQFTAGREDAELSQDAFCFRREHENGFRQIHLARDPLHLLIADPVAFGKHGERVAAERLVGENIKLNKIVAAQDLISRSSPLPLGQGWVRVYFDIARPSSPPLLPKGEGSFKSTSSTPPPCPLPLRKPPAAERLRSWEL